MIASCFRKSVADSEGTENHASLEKLYQLWALNTLETRADWFLDNGFFQSGKLTAVRKEVNRLCADVRNDALGFVEAFGIPDAALGAPIAFKKL